MAESSLNIRTTSDNAGIKDLVTALNSGKLTLADYNQKLRELRSTSIVGSQTQKELADVTYQVSTQTKTAAQMQNSLTGIIKSSRQEHRLYMFAVLESMRALDGLAGKNNQLTQSIRGGAEAFFGIKFALDMVGGTLAKFSLPLSLLIASLTLLKGLFGTEKDQTKELNDELQKQYDLRVKLGEISLQQQMIDAVQRINEAQNELTITENQQASATRNLAAATKEFVSMGTEPARMMMNKYQKELGEANSKIEAQRTAVLAAEVAYKALYDVQAKGIDKMNAFLDKQKKTERLTTEKDQTKELNIEGTLGARSGKSYNLIDQFAATIGAITPVSTINPYAKGAQKENERNAKEQGQATQDYLIDPLKAGFTAVAESTQEKFHDMFTKVVGGANSLFQQFFIAFADQLTAKLTEKATNYLLGLIPFQGGGTLYEPVVGWGMSTGRMYSFAEHEPEHFTPHSKMGYHGGGDSGIGQQVAALTSFLANHLTTPDGALFVLKSAGNVRKFGKTF